jgi:mono/diheme cytochrome c family protein
MTWVSKRWASGARVLGTGVFSVLLLLATGCQEKTTSKPISELTPQEATGQQVFARQCAGCHYANTEQGLAGPGLEKLFRKPYLSSGAPANDERVTSVILRGRGMMPPMGNALSDQDLQDLLAYLHTL